MLTKERFFRILELLDHKSFITIQELMEVLNASKSTVNRDLIELEKQGLIQRERGGAIKKEMPATLSSYRELPVMDKEHIHRYRKGRGLCVCGFRYDPQLSDSIYCR